MNLKKSTEYRIYCILLTGIIVFAVLLGVRIDRKLREIEDASAVVIHDVTLTEKSQRDKKTVYITPSGSKYHLKDCEYLGENILNITKEEAKKAGYKPCTNCQP